MNTKILQYKYKCCIHGNNTKNDEQNVSSTTSKSTYSRGKYTL